MKKKIKELKEWLEYKHICRVIEKAFKEVKNLKVPYGDTLKD